MELNNGHCQKEEGEDEDRLSMLPDDVLLSILGRVDDIATAARTSALSRRWKHLPWLLREFAIDVKDFLPTPHPNPVKAEHMDAAMASLTKAMRSFLGNPRSEATITTRLLELDIYLINDYSDAVGPLLAEAIDTGSLKDLDLAILDELEPVDCTCKYMLRQACAVDGFFSAYPSVIHCLTGLSLHNVCFAEWDMHHLLFDCCKQLRHLYLHNCDMGPLSAWKIDAPGSHLEVLELGSCCSGKLEVLHLPKLECLYWDGWYCPDAPLSLGAVPSLTELQLVCAALVSFQGFKLSDVLRGATDLQDLTLNFRGQNLWLRPEGKQLGSVFSRLRKLSPHDIFIEFDLLWMMLLLEAAPSVEMFDVEIWEHEHTCVVDIQGYYGERTSPSWKVAEFVNRKEWQLKELQVIGFSPNGAAADLHKGCDETSSQLTSSCSKGLLALCGL